MNHGVVAWGALHFVTGPNCYTALQQGKKFQHAEEMCEQNSRSAWRES